MNKLSGNKITIILLLTILIVSGCGQKNAMLTFPYSQWTIGPFSSDIIWKYEDDLEYNNSFIARPEQGEWNNWHTKLLAYRKNVREQIGKKDPELNIQFQSDNKPRIYFVKIGYDLNLASGETCVINAKFKSITFPVKVYIDFVLKTKGEEAGYIDRGILKNVDSLELKVGESWELYQKKIKIPAFNTDSFAVSPVLRFDSPSDKKGKIYLKDLQLNVPFTTGRKSLLSKIEKHIQQQKINKSLKISRELQWTNRNFVMGFVFIWDEDFWNPQKGEYTVANYCDKMQREFGGFQSVILWHSYPNIGIDERNQFDFYRNMPGGVAGVKQVVEEFHKRDIKVLMTYNPWDFSTSRPLQTDAKELVKLIDECKFDGIFLDTWSSSTGVTSNFSVEKFIREEVEKTGNHIDFETEMTPEFKDIFGYNATTGSWGQDIRPYHYTDLSLLKWIMPDLKQHFIARENTNRRRELTHAWINGQGIQVWENLFGSMNLWNANDRQSLRKMNLIWKSFGELYFTDNWKPFIPSDHSTIQASMWETKGMKIWNAINEKEEKNGTLKISVDPNNRYFDLWNGKELKMSATEGKIFITLPVERFGCLLQLTESSEILEKFIAQQKLENSVVLPDSIDDLHTKELSLKYPANPPKVTFMEANSSLLKVNAGRYVFECSHLNREGRCYPNTDAKNNHDLVLIHDGGELKIIHKHKQQLASFGIMPSVVTNGEFEIFLQKTNYSPRFRENFLKHWGGSSCPDSIKNEPVVYVSLEDARAYAAWTGQRLPTEWEWQAAAEQYKDAFNINEVWEWNESERNDGFNRFVNLRGGCSRWVMTSSWWYFPGAPYGEAAGGAQPVNSHCKYFLMYPGLDRASSIGFRCISLI